MLAVILSCPSLIDASATERVLLKPAAFASETALHSAFAQQGAREIERIPGLGVRVLQVPAHRRDIVIRALERNPNVAFAEADVVVHTLSSVQTTSSDYWHVQRIHAPAAWEITPGDSRIIMAFVDTGVYASHPALAGRLLPGHNVFNGSTDTTDVHGHGTRVAGILAAVAPQNSLLPVKAMRDDGTGFLSDVAKGIIYAADAGAHVINLSIGSSVTNITLNQAIEYAWNRNCVLVAGAGNHGTDVPVFPAAHPLVTGVSALNTNDQLPSWASYGDHVDLSAPGQSITTTDQWGGHTAVSGSSFASPIVAAVAGLVLAQDRTASNVDVFEILTLTADDLGQEGWDSRYGWGRVNAHDAVAVTALAGPDEPFEPADEIDNESINNGNGGGNGNNGNSGGNGNNGNNGNGGGNKPDKEKGSNGNGNGRVINR